MERVAPKPRQFLCKLPVLRSTKRISTVLEVVRQFRSSDPQSRTPEASAANGSYVGYDSGLADRQRSGPTFLVLLALGLMLNPTNSTMISTALTPIAEDFEANVTQPGCHRGPLPDQRSLQVPDRFAALLRSRTPLAQGLAPFVRFTNE